MRIRGERAVAPHNVVGLTRRAIRASAPAIALALAMILGASLVRAQSSAGGAAPQPQTQTQSPTPAANDSAAKKAASPGTPAAASAPKAKAKRVYTEDDLSSLHGKISVVGGDSARGDSSEEDSSDTDRSPSSSRSSSSAAEERWREMAQQIKDQIANVDRQIADKKAEIAKAGGVAFDPSSGLSQGVIVIHDRNAQLKQLEDHKRSLEQQLQNLADQGRQAGADPGWFR